MARDWRTGGDVEGHRPSEGLEDVQWRSLLELPSADLIPSFGDGGSGWVVLPASDLRAGLE